MSITYKTFFTGAKKPKRDNRKVPGFVADTLGPALFSTPDIIRRVGSNSDGKVTDNPATPITPSTSFATVISASGSSSSISTAVSLNIGISAASNVIQNTSNLANKKIFNTSEQSVSQPEPQLNFDGSNNIIPGNENEQKSESKTEELQPSLDTGKIKSYIGEIL